MSNETMTKIELLKTEIKAIDASQAKINDAITSGSEIIQSILVSVFIIIPISVMVLITLAISIAAFNA